MNDEKRRNALKALAVGAPAVWAAPVVEGAILPAHANTSCSPQPLPGLSSACSDPVSSEFTITPFLIQAEGGCFTLVQGETFNSSEDPQDVGIPYSIFLSRQRSGIQIRVEINTFDGNGDSINGLNCCQQFFCRSLTDDEYVDQRDALDTAGNPRLVTFMGTVDSGDSSVTLSNILVS